MVAFSDFLEDALIKHIFGDTTYGKPAQLWIALTTDANPITDASTGTSIVEPANGYLRVQLDPGSGNWTTPSGTDGQTSNIADITWAAASGGNWGNINYVAICSASTAGDILFHGALQAPVTINDGEIFKFAATSLTVTLA